MGLFVAFCQSNMDVDNPRKEGEKGSFDPIVLGGDKAKNCREREEFFYFIQLFQKWKN